VAYRQIELAELADLTAGLSSYRLPFAHWARTLPWAGQSGIDLKEIYSLGRKALQITDHTETGEYARTLLARNGAS
jgi:hypothetical protein